MKLEISLIFNWFLKFIKNIIPLFHSDTVQSVGHYDLDFENIKVDFFVASAHKFHGPKGVGFAFVRKNTNLGSYITGDAGKGAQSRN